MDFLISGRQNGKTLALMKWLTEAPEGEHRVMACHSHPEAMRLLRLSRDLSLDLEPWQFVGPIASATEGRWSSVLRGRGGEIRVGIDNADIWLSSLWLPFQVDRVTATGELWKAEYPKSWRKEDEASQQ